MSLQQHQKKPFVKSWVGLSLGLLFVGLSGWAWFESREASSWIAGLGFLCFTYPWSQLTSFKDPKPLPLAESVMTYIALALLITSTFLRFFFTEA